MDSESNTTTNTTTATTTTTDSDEKRDTVAELPDLPRRDPAVDVLTLQTQGMEINEASPSKSAAVSRQDMEVDSIYNLRTGYKGWGLDPTARYRARKRKGKERKTNVGPNPDPEEACKRLKKGKKDDEPDKDGAGAGAEARMTRSASRMRKDVSV